MNKKKTTSVIATVAGLMLGCGELASVEQNQASTLNAAISRSQLIAAIASVNKIDYLPFSQSEDGCYARSLFMAMEIAALGIPVSNQFLIATTGSLNPAPGYNWDYHVAPSVWLQDDPEPLIIDPSLFDYVAKRSEWVRKLNPTGSIKTKFGPGSETVVGSTALRPGPIKRSDMIRNLPEVGQFRATDIMFSCEMMAKYINEETHLSTATRQVKVKKLKNRSKSLIVRLTNLGLGRDTGSISRDVESCR